MRAHTHTHVRHLSRTWGRPDSGRLGSQGPRPAFDMHDRCVRSGREDVDVRMLGEGRPFIVEICDPHSRHRRRAEPTRAGAHAATRLGDATAQAIHRRRRVAGEPAAPHQRVHAAARGLGPQDRLQGVLRRTCADRQIDRSPPRMDGQPLQPRRSVNRRSTATRSTSCEYSEHPCEYSEHPPVSSLDVRLTAAVPQCRSAGRRRSGNPPGNVRTIECSRTGAARGRGARADDSRRRRSGSLPRGGLALCGAGAAQAGGCLRHRAHGRPGALRC